MCIWFACLYFLPVFETQKVLEQSLVDIILKFVLVQTQLDFLNKALS